MSPLHYVLAFLATVTIVITAAFLSPDALPWRKAHTLRPSPGPPATIDPSLPQHQLFEAHYQAKLHDPDYQAFKSQAGLPTAFQHFPEELSIKHARSDLAKRMSAPANIKPIPIPVINKGHRPVIDGRFAPSEWDMATALAMGTNGATTTLHIAADEDALFLACDAWGEKTEEGYDQFRFYFHLDITPMLVNERIHVGPGAGRLGGIRQTRVRWPKPAGANELDRWKKYDVNDWQIYQNARGASTLDGHRRYEAVLDLEEIGLHHGVPFPAWAEVETDPHRDADGKSTGRRYLGQMGAQTAPIWFVIQ